MHDSSSQFFLATVLLTMLSFSIFTYNLVPSFAYDYSPFGDDNDDNHSGDSSSDDRDNRRDRGHSDDSNSDDDGNWRDHDHSGDTNSAEGEASDSMSQAGDSYGASSDDTQSGDSASQEGSPNYDTNDLGASNNLAENSDSSSEISDPINSVENSADQSGTVDTPESNGSSNTDNSTSQSNVYIASDPAGLIGDGSMSIYSISMSNYSSNQNTQNPVDETLAAASGFMDALMSNATSSEKGGHEAGPSNSELSNQSASSGNSREPTLTNQTGNSSSMRSPSAADPNDALLGLLGGSSNHHHVVIATILSSPTTEASSQRTSNATSATASIISTSSAIPSVTARSGNKTISVPEEGNVTLSYTSLLSQGKLTALPVKTTSELAVMNITQGANQKPGKLMALDNTPYIPVGTVFIIAPTDARFNGTITVVIPYNMTLAGQQAGQDVKILHYTGSTWEDVTTFPPANGHLVTGSLSTTLGPVVAAVKSE